MLFEFGHAPFEGTDGPEHFGQTRIGGRSAQPNARIERGRAADDCSLGHVVAHPGLGPDDRVFVDGDVPRRTGLARHDDVFFEDGAAGESGLAADDVVLSHYAGVPDLAQAIDFGAAFHASFTDRGAVDGGQSLDLDVVFKNGDTGLDDLVLGAVRRFREAKPSPPMTTPLCSVTRSPMRQNSRTWNASAR